MRKGAGHSVAKLVVSTYARPKMPLRLLEEQHLWRLKAMLRGFMSTKATFCPANLQKVQGLRACDQALEPWGDAWLSDPSDQNSNLQIVSHDGSGYRYQKS